MIKWDELKKKDDIIAEKARQEKENRIAELKRYLADTDFYYARLAEIGEAVPEDVKEKRIAARQEIQQHEDH